MTTLLYFQSATLNSESNVSLFWSNEKKKVNEVSVVLTLMRKFFKYTFSSGAFFGAVKMRTSLSSSNSKRHYFNNTNT